MKRLPFPGLLTAAICLGVVSTSVATAAGPASLKTFLQREGYGGSPLERRFGNHLFVHTLMNGRRTALMIDTGSARTLIDRETIQQLELPVRHTRISVGGVWGWKPERYSVGNLSTLVMGNCTFNNVPIAVADESHINKIRGPHLDGLFGTHEMSRFGIIIDCTRQMIYVNPTGPSPAATERLSEYLTTRGFTRIPMRLNESQHLTIDASLNGHRIQLIVDTGASTTLLSAPTARASGVSLSGATTRVHQPNAGLIPLNVGRVRQLTLGNFEIPNAEVVVSNIAAEVGAGLLGEEHLSWNFGVIDVGGLNLFLRAPESAPAKKR